MGIDGNNPVAAGRRVTAVTAAAACLWMAVVVAVVGATGTASSSSSLLWPSSSSSAFSFTEQRTVLRRAEDAAAGGRSDTALLQLLHFELRPTAALVQERLVQHEGRRRRRRRRRRDHKRNVRKLVAADGGSDDGDDGTVQDKQYSSILQEDGGAENGGDTDEPEPLLPEEWFHPFSRAVYATLHPPVGIFDREMEDEEEEDAHETVAKQKAAAAAAAAYEDFVKYRHLSRYERQLRLALQLDLHPHWHGNYSDTPFYGDGNVSPMDRLTNEYYDLTTLDATDHNESNRNEADLPPLVSSRRLTRASTRNGTNDGSGTASNQRDDRESRRRRHRRRHLLESLVGGKFDNYQGVPLSQGYGTHYVHLWVGSPTPQRQSVIVDTGSHFTGFPVQGTSVRHCFYYCQLGGAGSIGLFAMFVVLVVRVT